MQSSPGFSCWSRAQSIACRPQQVFYEAQQGQLDVNYPRNASYQPFKYFGDYAVAANPVSNACTATRCVFTCS